MHRLANRRILERVSEPPMGNAWHIEEGRILTLRRFLYLDEKLVRESIAQADSGIFEEQTITKTEGKDGKLGGEARGGILSARAERGKVSSEEIGQVLRQTPESQYNRLHAWMEESGNLTDIFADDRKVWDGLRSSEAIAVNCDIEISPIARLLSSPDELAGLSNIASLLGQSLDESQQAALAGISALSQSSEQKMVAIGEVEEGAPKIVMTLKKESIRVDLEDLESEAVVMGILNRKIPDGGRHMLLNLPGMNLMPRAERRRMAQAPTTDNSLFIQGPLGIVTPIAIF
ncbi:DUF6414 family protein [Streptomyces xiamenensis]